MDKGSTAVLISKKRACSLFKSYLTDGLQASFGRFTVELSKRVVEKQNKTAATTTKNKSKNKMWLSFFFQQWQNGFLLVFSVPCPLKWTFLSMGGHRQRFVTANVYIVFHAQSPASFHAPCSSELLFSRSESHWTCFQTGKQTDLAALFSSLDFPSYNSSSLPTSLLLSQQQEEGNLILLLTMTRALGRLGELSFSRVAMCPVSGRRQHIMVWTTSHPGVSFLREKLTVCFSNHKALTNHFREVEGFTYLTKLTDMQIKTNKWRLFSFPHYGQGDKGFSKFQIFAWGCLNSFTLYIKNKTKPKVKENVIFWIIFSRKDHYISINIQNYLKETQTFYRKEFSGSRNVKLF